MDTFSETQKFRQWWVWLLMGFIMVIIPSGLYLANAWNKLGSPFILVTSTLPIVLLYVWRQDTRLDSEGIHYRVFPFIAWRTISWTSIRSASVQTYGFVGYGIRWGFEGWVYNVAGDKGLRVVFPDKHQITIGTQRPEEIQTFLVKHSTLITT